MTEDHIIKIALDDIESADLRDPLALYKYIKAKMVDEDLYSYEYSFLYFLCHFVINPLQKYDKVIICAMFLCCFVAWASIGIALCVAVVWFYF